MPTSLKLNGRDVETAADPESPLLWVLRDDLGLVGTKFGCGMALCGACTVHVDGQPARSCSLPLKDVAGKAVTTIEGASDAVSKAVIEAWVAHGVAQCGYCQPGQVMSASALLHANPRPTDAEVDAAMAGNVCRCGTYPRIRAAVRDAAKRLAG
ncbi:MAG: Isoquinoline 1-oxidoreductase subunit alpha [Pseudomonadota bacterium]|jgi:isoquinoline 1-oxidoreductase alpha subunit